MAKRGNVSIVIAGAAGKMGQALLRASAQVPGLRVAGALEYGASPAKGREAFEMAGLPRQGVFVECDALEALRKGDILVDFTSPEGTLEHLAAAAKLKKKAVIGTTGFDARQLKVIESFGRKQACVLSSNFSVGVNLLWKVIADVARVTGDDYDVEIIEAHHRLKKDAPSGTAITTAKVLAKALGRPFEQSAKFGRGREMGQRKHAEIGLHAVRGGDIVGDHTVLFAGPGERLEFIHRAHTRENLAGGALKAALWVAAKPRGLFSMGDVLGL